MESECQALPCFDSTKLYPREFNLDSGEVVTIFQSEIGDVGCVVWDAAIVLAKYLEKVCTSAQHEDPSVRCVCRSRIVELGSGTGFVGIVAACLGASVLLTDLTPFVKLMQTNVDVNASLIRKASGSASVAALKWGAEDTHHVLENANLASVDMILISDCIYYDQSLEPLVNTLAAVSQPNTAILCSYEERTSDDKRLVQRKFFELMERDFLAARISHDDQHPLYHSHDIRLWQFKRKPEID